jgi:hypothetical protein
MNGLKKGESKSDLKKKLEQLQEDKKGKEEEIAMAN